MDIHTVNPFPKEGRLEKRKLFAYTSGRGGDACSANGSPEKESHATYLLAPNYHVLAVVDPSTFESSEEPASTVQGRERQRSG